LLFTECYPIATGVGLTSDIKENLTTGASTYAALFQIVPRNSKQNLLEVFSPFPKEFFPVDCRDIDPVSLQVTGRELFGKTFQSITCSSGTTIRVRGVATINIISAST
jgi:hypothetical protein